MKVSIIGSTGFLGNALREHPLLKECSLLSFGRQQVNVLSNEQFIKADILGSFPFEKLTDQDIIFYCAGMGVQSGVAADHKSLYYINTYFPVALAEYLNEQEYKGTLVTFGSYFEIGNNSKPEKFSEKELVYSPYEVPNAYCISKRLFTKYVNDTKQGIKKIHLILPTIYGEQENKNRLIPYLVEKMKRQLPVALTEGRQVRQYLYVDDLIEIIFNTHQELEAGIYNVPSQCTLSIKELAYKVAGCFNFHLGEESFNTAERKDISMLDLQLGEGKIHSFVKGFQFKTLEEIIPKY